MKKRIQATDQHPSRPAGAIWSAPAAAAGELIKKGWAEPIEDAPKSATNSPKAPAQCKPGEASPAKTKED
jgi:hypothetical protein